mmetsp:Transcript_16158/g.48409  ORF Transcript_16158/g.48409 Transcript_16158/m.48409 type:complete len:789 (+) Transcript_16158:141-2507(+)
MVDEDMENAGALMQLRSELFGHEEDVRGLAVDGTAGFLTASRDRTLKVWREAGPQAFDNTLSLVGHEDYVTTVVVLPSKSASQGAFVSGSRDKTVRIWDTSGSNVEKLEGHKWQVTAVVILSDGSIASASLDGTIRIWSNGKSTVLEGHEGPVQCLAVLPDGALLSGSNDKTIRRWIGSACQQTITGHSDTVRGLAVVPGLGFVSASHDQTLQIWTAAGESIATLVGHTAIVYSAAASSDGTIASASEDNTARLWRVDGSCLQVIEHQACVWTVAFLPNGDLVTGCSDFAARVWTAAADRAAPAEAQKAYLDAVEARKAASGGGGAGGGGALPDGLKMHDAMALMRAGERDGQTIVIREGGGGMAYSWSAQRGEWEKLGEVVSGPQDTMAVGGKQHLGQTWDYVFDVDIADGAPVKKLPANKGEDPYVAADRFLEQEQLPLSYREQIAQFVVENSHGGIQYDMPSFNADPFTGGGAYVPSGNTPAAGAGQTQAHSLTGGGYDPFTGGSSAPTSSTVARHVPARTFVAFTAVPKLEALSSKIREHSQQLGAGSSLALSAEEVAPQGTVDQLLARAASGARDDKVLASPLVQLLLKLLSWPAAQLFPIMDVARLLALQPEFASALAQASSQPGAGVGAALAAAMAEPQTAFNQQTALRLACNAFVQPSLRTWIATQVSSLLDGFAPALTAPSKAVRLAAATLLLNASILNDSELNMQVLSGLLEVLSNPTETDAETQYRAIVAVGTLVHGDSTMRTTAVDIGLKDNINQRQSTAVGKIAEAAQDVLHLLG